MAEIARVREREKKKRKKRELTCLKVISKALSPNLELSWSR